jgi:predicted DNA-binding ribbon-helix-helix protein
LINRNVVAERGRTSMRLEPELWDALAEICRREHQDISRLVRQIEATGHSGGRTSAVRVFVLQYFRELRARPGTRPPVTECRIAHRSATTHNTPPSSLMWTAPEVASAICTARTRPVAPR